MKQQTQCCSAEKEVAPEKGLFAPLVTDKDTVIYVENKKKDTSIQINEVASEDKDKKIRILENQNRKRNLKNRRMDAENKRWSAFKKAPGTQTSDKNSEKKKGDNVVE